jgi:hypothetical protein
MLDPVLQLDPTFANSADFSLAFSPGIGNAPESSVPEPSSLLFLAIGILGLIVVRTQRFWWRSHTPTRLTGLSLTQ